MARLQAQVKEAADEEDFERVIEIAKKLEERKGNEQQLMEDVRSAFERAGCKGIKFPYDFAIAEDLAGITNEPRGQQKDPDTYWRKNALTAVQNKEHANLTDVCKQFAKLDQVGRNIKAGKNHHFFSVILSKAVYNQAPLSEAEQNLKSGGYVELGLNEKYVLVYKGCHQNQVNQKTLRDRFQNMLYSGYFENEIP